MNNLQIHEINQEAAEAPANDMGMAGAGRGQNINIKFAWPGQFQAAFIYVSFNCLDII